MSTCSRLLVCWLVQLLLLATGRAQLPSDLQQQQQQQPGQPQSPTQLQQPQSYQPSYNKDYSPRYNPLYTGQQQNPDSTQYDNPLLDFNNQPSNPNYGGAGLNPNNYNGYNNYDGNRPLLGTGSNIGGPGSIGNAGPQYDPFNRNAVTGNSAIGYRDMFTDEDNFCPEHWVSFRQTCYRFIRSPKRNWAEAKKICKAYTADLLNVDNVEKHSFILKQLILQNQRQNRFFISARQTGPQNWVNDDNTQLVQIEDSFAFDEQQALENEDLIDNRFLVQNDPNNRNFNNNPNQYYNSLAGTTNLNQRNQNNLRGYFGMKKNQKMQIHILISFIHYRSKSTLWR